MPSSLIIVALVVAWLLVLVPIVARRRQEVARTADSTLAARVVRSGGVRGTLEEERAMPDAREADTAREDKVDGDFGDEFAEDDEFDGNFEEFADDELADDELDGDAAEYEDEYDGQELADAEFDDAEFDGRGAFVDGGHRPYRPGRGGFDAEAAAISASARYAFRQRIVVLLLLAAVGSAVAAGMVTPMLWWAHAGLDLGLVGYLAYLRRQVRIEEEIRERRTARLGATRRAPEHEVEYAAEQAEPGFEAPSPVRRPAPTMARPAPRPGTVVVDTDDEDPMFTDLDEPAGALPYRRAVGE